MLPLLRPGIFMTKLDIKDAYYSVTIHQPDQTFLKFHFNNTLFQYNALPNGYTEAPETFTKL